MPRIDDTNLLIAAPKEALLFVADDLDPEIAEVMLGVQWRGRVYTAARNLAARLREVRVSRGLTDHEKNVRVVGEFDRFDSVLVDGRKVLAKIRDGIAAREGELRPSHKPVFEVDASVMQTDLMLIDRAEQFGGDQQRDFLIKVAEGDALAIRIADALMRVGSLCKNLSQQWISVEVGRELFEFRNLDLLDGLRHARIIASRMERTLDELEAASRGASSMPRHAVGQIQSTANV